MLTRPAKKQKAAGRRLVGQLRVSALIVKVEGDPPKLLITPFLGCEDNMPVYATVATKRPWKHVSPVCQIEQNIFGFDAMLGDTQEEHAK
jgi:hypothetical protein